MMERLGSTGLLPIFSSAKCLLYQTEPLLDPGMVGTLLAGNPLIEIKKYSWELSSCKRK
jgi:hypothetical protein